MYIRMLHITHVSYMYLPQYTFPELAPVLLMEFHRTHNLALHTEHCKQAIYVLGLRHFICDWCRCILTVLLAPDHALL